MPLLAIRGYLCSRCLEHSEELASCKDCNRVTYCSIDCQLVDWHIAHRSQCKTLQHVNAIEQREAVNDRTWDEYIDALVCIPNGAVVPHVCLGIARRTSTGASFAGA